MKIAFTGGGTGGHILPIIALARELQLLFPDAFFVYLGPRDRFTADLLSQEGIRVHWVATGKLRRSWNPRDIFLTLWDFLFRIPVGTLHAFSLFLFGAPDLLFSKGGYGAVPVTIAAWILGIPVFLHESDSVPGKANLLAARFAKKVFVSFLRTQGFPKNKLLVTGNPIRMNLLGGSRERAAELFSLQGTKPVLLVLGGSQGAIRINELILGTFPEMLKEFELIHQTGNRDLKRVKGEAEAVTDKTMRASYHPIAFLREQDLRHAYAAADLICSRAGGGVLFEIAALGKPSVLIPLPEAAQDHQLQNAYEYAKSGAAIVLEAPNLTPHFFLQKLKNVLSNPRELEHMKTAASAFAKPNAAKTIAEYLVKFLAP
ncbi:UDP-N-acetylglucosamine--N-acetylmuramyl-(pentapeptide) pyrophosphoryl-undecaprenol N-acetylglucosamine transferase [Patescibacteria group bacterium]|nr:UDP-N-acetylglucosamine--N-acetylmuramyl-(pentapeptide) pyrophosphoryl-undecaprenol N-acetylglucosamine transferase [Patescibacteria group bacterium]